MSRWQRREELRGWDEKEEVSWQEKEWDPNRRLGKLGVGGPVFPKVSINDTPTLLLFDLRSR